MISRIRKFLGLETEEEKMQDWLEINKSISDLHKSIEEVADDFTSKNEGYKELLKSENLTEEFKKSIEQRHKFLIEDQKEEIQSLVKQRNKLREQHKSLMKDEKIFKAVSEVSFYDNLKAKYKANELTPKQYDIILKAKQGKVLYADNIVFNEKGQILLLQRTRVEDDKNGGKWVIPGGHVDAGEEFYEAALRELQEESGLDLKDCEEVGLFEDNGVEIHYFESHVKEKDVQIVLQDKESESFVWVHLDELDKYDMPFNMAENILNLYPHCKEEVLNISKAVESGRLSQEFGNELIEKARSGIYQNTAENRKKGIVGMKYGSTKPVEPKKDEGFSKEEKDKNFKKWFGDSKVVDEKGNPLVVYHGTRGDFSEFRRGIDIGIHFGTTYQANNRIKNENASILPVYLKIENPIILPDLEVWSPVEVMESIENHSKVRFDELFKKLMKDKLNKQRNYDWLMEELVDNGVDGIIYDNEWEGEGKSYIVFNSNQIKSAIGNKGAFDLNSNDITKSLEYFLNNGSISKELFEKAKRTGVYTDTAENRRLKRVGQKYSKDKQGEVSTEKEGKQEEPSNKEAKDLPIEEHAKQASETALQNASKSGDEELRVAAKKELERRETEHQPEGEKEQPSDKKSETDTSSDKKEESVSENEHIEKFRTLSDEQVKFYLDAPNEKVKLAAEEILKERGVDVITKEEIELINEALKDNSVSIDKLREVVGGSTDRDVVQNTYSILGGKSTIGEIKSISFNRGGDFLNIEAVTGLVSLDRVYYPNKKEVENFRIEVADKGKGLGAKIFKNQVEQYQKLGYKTIKTAAVKSDKSNGYYTWARLGFDFETKEDKEKFKNWATEFDLADFNSLSELMKNEQGRRMWKDFGFPFMGEFDLDKNSDNIKSLNDYGKSKSTD